jgi:hypothetical protein
MLALTVQAENNSALGKVVQFASNKGQYTFQFVQSEGGEDILPGCRQLKVEVRYALAPKAWLPFTHSNYPTKKETNTAINFLKKALREGREIYFSSVSNGLFPTKAHCTFASRALALEYLGEKELIVSYYGKE